jgi:glycosyltransferase involved in cell wall biosynthesis
MSDTDSLQLAKNPEYLKDSKIVVYVPAFNEAKNIADIIEKTKKYVTEVLVYDDGSSDDTYNVAISAGAEVIRGRNNRGYGAAIIELFQKASSKGADLVVTIDSDGQHDPSETPRLIEPILREEADIVIGSRFLSKLDSMKVPSYRRFGIKTITRIAKAASYDKITDAQSGFRAYNRKALSKIHVEDAGMSVSTEILLRAKEGGLQVAEVPITVRYDIGNTSTLNPFFHGMQVLAHLVQSISFRHPFLFYGLPGLVLLLFAAIFLYNAIELFSSTRYISTNMILVSIGLALIGVILLSTGVVVYTLVALFRGKIKVVHDDVKIS